MISALNTDTHLSEELVRVGDRLFAVRGYSKLGGCGGTNAGNFLEVTGDVFGPPAFHAVIRDLGLFRIVSFRL